MVVRIGAMAVRIGIGLGAALGLTGHAAAQATIKIAYTDPLSGPFAQVGDANLKMMNYIIDFINSKGGALGRKFELVPFDNKSQPADALLALKSATDQNMPFILLTENERKRGNRSLVGV